MKMDSTGFNGKWLWLVHGERPFVALNLKQTFFLLFITSKGRSELIQAKMISISDVNLCDLSFILLAFYCRPMQKCVLCLIFL